MARAAASIQAGSSSAPAALANPRIASPFHAVSTLSSRPGRSRRERSSNSLRFALAKQFAGFLRLHRKALHHGVPGIVAVQVPLALDVGGLVDAVQGLHHQVFVSGQKPPDSFAAPQVETAFLAFGVGIEGGEEPAPGVAHLAQQPFGGSPHGPPRTAHRGRGTAHRRTATAVARCRRASSRSAEPSTCGRWNSGRSRRRDGRRCRPGPFS